jgi:hypothetical protein
MNPIENNPPEEGLAPPPQDHGNHLKNVLGAFLLIVLSIAFAIAALRIPFQTSNWVWYTSPGIFALVMAICLGTCSAYVAVREFRLWQETRIEAGPIGWGKRLRQWGIGRFLGASAIILIYILLLGRIPFLVASAALVLTLGTVFREGRFRDALRPSIIAVLVVIAVAVVISKIFGIMFP